MKELRRLNLFRKLFYIYDYITLVTGWACSYAIHVLSISKYYVRFQGCSFSREIHETVYFAILLKQSLFQECEGSLKHKTELITKLEAKTLSMTETIQKMDEKYVYLPFITVN